jgi:acyl-CoA dehydrogenase
MKAMFEETVERLMSDLVTSELIGAAETGTWPTVLWNAIEENGLTVAAAPESTGGIGASWHDAFVLVRAAGRHAAPVPLAETVLVNWLLGLAGLDVAPGAATLATGGGSIAGESFTGTLADVPWGAQCGHVLTVADGTLLLLACGDARVSRALNTAREPRDTLVFEDVTPVAMTALPAFLPPDLPRLGGAMIRSAQIAGGLGRLLDTATEYANQRVQFGRTIGKFQAIQHQLAILAEQTGLASAAAEMAFASSGGGPAPLAIAAAKSVASDAAGQGAAIGHAVLGAIGFTYEHTLHFTTRRVWSWRSEFGSQTHWAQILGRHLCDQGSEGLWPALVSATA